MNIKYETTKKSDEKGMTEKNCKQNRLKNFSVSFLAILLGLIGYTYGFFNG